MVTAPHGVSLNGFQPFEKVLFVSRVHKYIVNNYLGVQAKIEQDLRLISIAIIS